MKENSYKLLDQLKIQYTKLTHPPLYTCEDAIKYRVEFAGLDVKNLFIRNANKSQFYMVILPFNKRANLAELQEKLFESKMSFASENSLNEMLKVSSGAVSLLNVANIEEQHKNIIIILDAEIFTHQMVGFHPSDNTETVVFATTEIEKILAHVGIRYRAIKL
jgi:Ala-tRNA(Pro) deacylase